MHLPELVHDMRNALTVARANLEAIVDGKLAPTPQRLDAVLRALAQVESMLEDLRAAGPHVLGNDRTEPLNVCELLQSEYLAIEPIAQAKGIAVSVERCAVPTEDCKHFYGDRSRIAGIVKNILLNAVRYTPAGGSVDIDCSRRMDQLEIQISDSGPGVKPLEVERIFEPGVRGSASDDTAGSGYGLAIVKRLVEEQGGQVSVESPAGGGARFVVRLPGTLELSAADCAACAAGPIRRHSLTSERP